MYPHYPLSIIHYSPRLRRAFTLMELMVSVSILVIIILSVGIIFQSVSKTVGVSEASMEMLSNVRSIQRQLESDLSGLNKNGFLVIRSGIFTDASVTPNIIRRGDQISFMANGSFVNRTGTTSGFTDNNTVVPSAFVWWGQLALENPTSTWTIATSTDPRTYMLSTTPNTKVPLNQAPNGLTDANFILGRHTTMLVVRNDLPTNNQTPNGAPFACYPITLGTPTLSGIDYNNLTLLAGAGTTGETANNDITQSRVSGAQSTPAEVMTYLQQAIGPSRGTADPNIRYEANHYCYRYAALTNPYDGTTLVNGYYRMHPIALQGVPSVAIDWTDGSVYVGGETDVISGNVVGNAAGQIPIIGTTKWFGTSNTVNVGLAKGGAFVDKFVDHALPALSAVDAVNSYGDKYTAIFSYDNPNSWPVALRFRYHVADTTGRLPAGRDFVQVIKLP